LIFRHFLDYSHFAAFSYAIISHIHFPNIFFFDAIHISYFATFLSLLHFSAAHATTFILRLRFWLQLRRCHYCTRLGLSSR